MSTSPSLQAPPTQAEVVLYTTDYCGFCIAAKRLFKNKGVVFREVRCDTLPELRDWLAKVSKQRTVPQVFINGASVGGYRELATLQVQGKLDAMLATPPAPDTPPLPW